jgi:hypothetical protein
MEQELLNEQNPESQLENEENEEIEPNSEESEETVEDVFNTLTDEQKNAVCALIDEVLKDAGVSVDDE